MSEPAETLTHRVSGSGEPLLLLNGGMMTFASWQPLAVLLQDHHQLVLCDLRGQLLTPGPSHERLEGHVEDLLRLLEDLELDKVHVLGTSFGAEVGLLLAATHPERVSSLIAVTAVDYASDAMRRGVHELREIVEGIGRGGDKGDLHDLLVAEVYSDAYTEANAEELAARRQQVSLLPDIWFEGLQNILACTESFDLRPHLERVRCPTLVVIASQDQVMPPEHSRALAAAISDARVVVHPTSGHALVAEDPDWLARECLEFLRRNSDA